MARHLLHCRDGDVGSEVVGLVADALDLDQFGAGDVAGEALRMQVLPDDVVAVAGDDDGGRRYLDIEMRLRLEVIEQAHKVGGVVVEGGGAQHQRGAGFQDVIVRPWVGTEDIEGAAFKAPEAKRHDQRMVEEPADHRGRRDVIVPVDATGPRVRGGREEEQASRLFRMADAECGGDGAAEGMADNDRLVDAALFHQRGDGVRLA